MQRCFDTDDTRRPLVLIVGGGFGGLSAAKRLKRAPVRIYLADQQNYHLFQPLLYQVATAALSPAEIAQPIRQILRGQRNLRVGMRQITGVDLDRRVVTFPGGEGRYDYLVLACGATHSYFGNEHWQRKAPGLKTIDDALEIRRRILLAFEAAEQEEDEAARRARLTFIVVGGGPTGVEMAGAIRQIAAEALPRDFHHISTHTTRVILLEAGPRLLPMMHPQSSQRAQRDLQAMDVEVRLDSRVTDVDTHGVMIGDERLAAGNVIWAAGVKAAPLAQTLGVPLDAAGRVPVAPDLSIPGYPQVFVIGDLAAVNDPDTAEPVPGLAPAAMQMGRFVADIISRETKAPNPAAAPARPAFRYRDKGRMATIGRARAVAEIAGRRFGGLLAWLLWSAVHVAFLVGFRNKLFVLLNWLWHHTFFASGARLITGAQQVPVKRLRNDLNGDDGV